MINRRKVLEGRFKVRKGVSIDRLGMKREENEDKKGNQFAETYL